MGASKGQQAGYVERSDDDFEAEPDWALLRAQAEQRDWDQVAQGYAVNQDGASVPAHQDAYAQQEYEAQWAAYEQQQEAEARARAEQQAAYEAQWAVYHQQQAEAAAYAEQQAAYEQQQAYAQQQAYYEQQQQAYAQHQAYAQQQAAYAQQAWAQQQALAQQHQGYAQQQSFAHDPFGAAQVQAASVELSPSLAPAPKGYVDDDADVFGRPSASRGWIKSVALVAVLGLAGVFGVRAYNGQKAEAARVEAVLKARQLEIAQEAARAEEIKVAARAAEERAKLVQLQTTAAAAPAPGGVSAMLTAGLKSNGASEDEEESAAPTKHKAKGKGKQAKRGRFMKHAKIARTQGGRRAAPAAKQRSVGGVDSNGNDPLFGI